MEQAKALAKEPNAPTLEPEYQSSEESLSPALQDEHTAGTLEHEDAAIAKHGSAAEESESEDEDDDLAIIEVVEAKPFKLERAVAVNVAATGKANVVKVSERWSGFRGRHSQRFGSQSSTQSAPSQSRFQSQSPPERTESPSAYTTASPTRTPRPRIDTSASQSSASSATQKGASDGGNSPSATIASESSEESLQMQGTAAGPVDPFENPTLGRSTTMPIQTHEPGRQSRSFSTNLYDVQENRFSQAPTIHSRFNDTISQSRSSSRSRPDLTESRHSRSGTISSHYNETISQSRCSSNSRPATPQSTVTRSFTDGSLSRGPSSATSFSAGTSLSRGPSSATTYSTSLSRGPSSSTNYSTNSFVFPDSAATNHSFLEMDPYHLPQSQPLQKSNTRSKLRHVSSKLVASLNGPKSPASEGLIPVDDQTVDIQRRRSIAASAAPEMTARTADNTPFFFSQRARDEWYRRHEEKQALQTHDEKIPVPLIPRNKNPPPRSAGSVSSSSTSSTSKSLRFPRMLARGAGDRAPMPDLPPCPTGYDPFVPELTTTTSIVSGGSIKKSKGGSSKPKSGGLSWSRN